MRLLFTDIRNALHDINYDYADVVIQELSTTYTESSKLAYCLEINGHRLQVISEDKEIIEEIAKYIRVTAEEEDDEGLCYCDMDDFIERVAKGLKKSTIKNYTYNKYVLEKEKVQINLDGEALKREVDVFMDKIIQEKQGVNHNTLQEALIQANKDLRRFIPKK